MAIPTTPFDAAKYLTDEESQIELLNDALETASASFVVRAIRVIVRARSLAKPATELDISREALSEVIDGGAYPTIEATLAVLDGLGFELRARAKTSAVIEPGDALE